VEAGEMLAARALFHWLRAIEQAIDTERDVDALLH